MISIQIVFWGMVILFGIVGYMRGWQKEIIAMTGLVMSLAALSQFGSFIVDGTGILFNSDAAVDPFAIPRRQFWIQAVFHLVLAFFSYQVVGQLASQAFGGRLGERVRASLERRVIGFGVGAVNGYLLIGGLWGFLEYNLTAGVTGYTQLLPGSQYPFDFAMLVRPTAESAIRFMAWLPMAFSPTAWLVFFFITFVFIIIALI